MQTVIVQHIFTLHPLTTHSHTQICSHTKPTGQLTPANAQIEFEVIPLCKHSDDQEVVQVDAFHQQPVAVGHDTVLHHHHSDATANCCLQESGEVYFMNYSKNIKPCQTLFSCEWFERGAPSVAAGMHALCQQHNSSLSQL